jgi:hypothetical protein
MEMYEVSLEAVKELVTTSFKSNELVTTSVKFGKLLESLSPPLLMRYLGPTGFDTSGEVAHLLMLQGSCASCKGWPPSSFGGRQPASECANEG